MIQIFALVYIFSIRLIGHPTKDYLKAPFYTSVLKTLQLSRPVTFGRVWTSHAIGWRVCCLPNRAGVAFGSGSVAALHLL
jgi:hypothetical protein